MTFLPPEPPVGDPQYPQYPEQPQYPGPSQYPLYPQYPYGQYPQYPYYGQYPPPWSPPFGPPQPLAPDPARLRGTRIAAALTQLALAGTAMLQVPVILAAKHDRDVLHEFVNGTAAFDEVNDADDAVTTLLHIIIGAAVVTGVLFVVWMWRLRRDAEVFNPGRQQFGQGWVIGGWLIPFANLVMPYLVMSDIARALRSQLWTVGPGEPRLGLLRTWWGLWVVCALANRVLAATDPESVHAFDSYVSWIIAASVAVIVGAVLAISVVENLTRADLERWMRVAPAGAVPPSHR